MSNEIYILDQIERFPCDPLRLWNEQVEYAVQLAILFTYGLGGPCSRASGARLEMAGIIDKI
ncbi:hypothetical protein BDN67DRAFT_975994, partial [Paxillus ammoniavirescens]